MTRAPLAAAFLLITLFGVGCSSAYTLRGKVISGNISFATVVADSDDRMEGPGIGGVSIRLVSDPDKLKREILGETVTGPDGTFAIPFQRVGAGMMLYDVGLSARRDGFAPTVSSNFRLPPESKRMLILLVPGRDDYQDPVDNTPGALLDKFQR